MHSHLPAAVLILSAAAALSMDDASSAISGVLPAAAEEQPAVKSASVIAEVPPSVALKTQSSAANRLGDDPEASFESAWRARAAELTQPRQKIQGEMQELALKAEARRAAIASEKPEIGELAAEIKALEATRIAKEAELEAIYGEDEELTEINAKIASAREKYNAAQAKVVSHVAERVRARSAESRAAAEAEAKKAAEAEAAKKAAEESEGAADDANEESPKNAEESAPAETDGETETTEAKPE